MKLILPNSVKACAYVGVSLFCSDALATAIYSSDISAELTYSIVSGDVLDLDAVAETELFFSETTFSGNASASASGSNDAAFWTSPLLASASGSASEVGAANSDWSVDSFLDFENLGVGTIEIAFTLNWSYNELSSIDDALFEGADAFSFILLTEITDVGDVNELFEADTFFSPSLPNSDSGTLSFTRFLNAGDLYSLELGITAEGYAYSEARPSSSVPGPNPFALSVMGILGLSFYRRLMNDS